MTALASCRTVVRTRPIEIPTLTAVRPPLVPAGLIDDPQSAADILHNSVVYEFAMYDWQDYATRGLEPYIDRIKNILRSEK